MSKPYALKARKPYGKIVAAAVLGLVALMQIFPFYLQLITSFQPLDFYPEPGKIYFWPRGLHWKNYIEAIERVELLQGVLNSVVVSGGFTLLSAATVLVVGYVLGKMRFRGRRIVMFALLVTMIVPGELLMVTNYQLVSELNWTNSYAGLILPGIVNITGIFLVMSFMNTIPDATLEAAEIDGISQAGKLVKIVLPMSAPVLATYIILTFVGQWNDYLWPMVIVNDRELFTVQLKLKEFNPYYEGYADEVLKCAAFVVTIIPVLLVYICCQDKFVSGLSLSGLK